MKSLSALCALLLCGCTALKEGYVVTVTGTVVGVQLAQNQVSQMYEGKFGYVRSEIALVPTNGPPVLMEMRYSGIFSFGANSGIYQRLAVGSNAVTQAGAAVMFAKSPSGVIDPTAISAVNNLVRSMNQPPAPK